MFISLEFKRVLGIPRNQNRFRKWISHLRISLVFLLLVTYWIEPLYGCGIAPTADFSADNTTPVRGQTVTFTDASQNASSWSWNFGSNAVPGTAGTVGPHSVYYTSTGSKNVSLTVTGIGADTETKTAYITVLATPIPTAGNNGPVCEGSTLSLTASYDPLYPGATFSWTGPNGFTSSQQNPAVSASATAAMAGTYSVTATLFGYTSTAATTVVTVNALPATPTGIAASPGTICSGSSSTISVNNPGAGYTTDWYTESCGGTPVTGGTGVNSLPVSPSVTTTYFARTRNTTTGCISSNCASVEVTVNPNSWTGTTSNNWNVASNWSCGVPGAGSVVVIPSGGTQPRVRNGTSALCSTITINPGATLRINSGGLLTTSGTMINSGTVNIIDGGSLTISGDLTNSGTLIINSSVASSGSLIVEGTSTGDVTYVRQMRAEDNYGNRHFFSSPVAGQDVSGFLAGNTNVSQIWSYEETDASWPTVSSGNFVSGKGYNLRQTSGSTGSFTFTGTVVTAANIATTSPYLNGYTDRSSAFAYGDGNPGAIWTTGRNWTNYGAGGWNLLGNPFTCALDAPTFITSNSIKFDPNYQALYIYDGTTMTYQYAASAVPGYSEAGSFGDKVQAGQGFFVIALYDGLTFNFTSAMMTHSTSTAMSKSAKGTESEKTWPGLVLKVKKGDFENSTTVVFNEDMNAGLDPGYDVGLYSSGTDVEIYTNLAAENNGVSLTRQALPSISPEENIIPIGLYTADGGEMTFSASVIPLPGYKYLLEDRSSGIFTDLGESDYTAIINPYTYGTGQFFIHTSSSITTGIEPTKDNNVPDDLRLWISDRDLIIKGYIRRKASCQVYDMNGRKVLEKTLIEGDMNSVPMPSGLKGFFIVRVVDGLKVKTLKAIIPH